MQHPIMPHCNAHAAPLKSPIAPPRHALRACLCASLVLMAELCSANLLAAAVPTEWTVRIGPRSASYQAERRHGDALDLRATLTYNGQPLAYTGPARLYAQTNGMGSAWWDLAPCTVSSNVIQATWLPSFDTGADVVDIFLGGPSNYQAAARIRFLPSPGSVPNSLPLPAPTLDFATVQILNPPYYTRQETDSAIESAAPGDYSTVSNRAMSAIQEHQSLEPSTNYTDRALGAFAETGTVARARSYGTPTRWTDATGCVWEVNTGWRIYTNGVVAAGWTAWNYPEDSVDDEIFWSLMIGLAEDAGSSTYTIANQTLPYGTTPQWDSELTTIYNGDVDYNGIMPGDSIRAVRGETNLVGRVALTNDLPGAIISTISDFASTGTVHAAESSTYSSRLFDASFDAAYDATYLIRESTNAATAVSSSLVRYSLVTPGEWEFSDGGPHYISGPSDDGNGSFVFLLDGAVQSLETFSTESAANLALSLTFNNFDTPVTATRASLPGHLLDRAVNAMSISSITNIKLPALSHPGQARDFILLLDIPSSVTNTVPGLTGLLTFTPSGAETVHYYVDGDDPSTATFPLPTSPGTWSYSFSEFKASWFAVSLKPIVEAAAPGGAQ